jgi:hypothetical protein
MKKTRVLLLMILFPLVSTSCLTINPIAAEKLARLFGKSTPTPSPDEQLPGFPGSSTETPDPDMVAIFGSARPSVSPGNTGGSSTANGGSSGSGASIGIVADAKLLSSYLPPVLKVGLKWTFSTTTEYPNVPKLTAENSREITGISGDLISLRVILGGNTYDSKVSRDSFTGAGVTAADTANLPQLIVDGFETVTVPAGIYPNALRLKRIEKLDESTAVHISWHASGVGMVKDETTITWNGDGTLYNKVTEVLVAFSPGS